MGPQYFILIYLFLYYLPTIKSIKINEIKNIFILKQGDGGGSIINSNRIIGIISVLQYQQSTSIVFTRVWSFIGWIEDIKSKY